MQLFGEGPKIKGPARPGQHMLKLGYNMMHLGCICYICAAYAAPGLLHLECNSHQCNTRSASGLHMLQLDCIVLRLSCISYACTARDQKSNALHA